MKSLYTINVRKLVIFLIYMYITTRTNKLRIK